MAKEEKKAPKLRFNGYTNDWERKKLGDVAEKVIQKNNNNAFKNVLTNSAEYGIISQRDFFERNIANKNNISTYYIVQNDDFVYNPRISNLAPYGPINRNKTGYTGIISPLYYVFRVLNINTAFIEWYFKTTCWHKFMYQHGDSGARSDRFSIKDNELKKLPIKLPVDDMEQEKIAKTLTSLDNTLQLHERKCEELALIKQALLQKLFPKKDEVIPEVRYKSFSAAWEQRKLGGVAKFYSGGTPSVGVSDYYDGTIPFIRSAEINSTSTELYLSELGLQNSSAKMVHRGDILYALYGATSGEVGISKINGAINQAILAIIPHKGYNSEFLEQWLRKNKEAIIKTYLQGGQGNLSGAIVKQIKVSFPSFDEQQKIGKSFQKIDSLITLHQRKLEKLKQLKKFLLQNMFI